jgi:hypothetical protein
MVKQRSGFLVSLSTWYASWKNGFYSYIDFTLVANWWDLGLRKWLRCKTWHAQRCTQIEVSYFKILPVISCFSVCLLSGTMVVSWNLRVVDCEVPALIYPRCLSYDWEKCSWASSNSVRRRHSLTEPTLSTCIHSPIAIVLSAAHGVSPCHGRYITRSWRSTDIWITNFLIPKQ